MSLSYRTFSDFLAERFDCKMQKLTVDAGFSCPNRDGTLSTGGCIYCNNSSFTPLRAQGDSVAAQIARSKEFFARKYPSMRYLAYFQAYTGTHAPVDTLLRLYSEALAQISMLTASSSAPDPTVCRSSFSTSLRRCAAQHLSWWNMARRQPTIPHLTE